MPPTLLTLPTEIRLLILEGLLTSPYISPDTGKPEIWPDVEFKENDFNPELRHALDLSPVSRNSIHPQILRVCKQIHWEGTKILYSGNRFWIRTLNIITKDGQLNPGSQAQIFMRNIGRKNASLLRHITVEGDAISLHAEQLKKCFELGVGLKELKIVGLCSHNPNPYHALLKITWTLSELWISSPSTSRKLSVPICMGILA